MSQTFYTTLASNYADTFQRLLDDTAALRSMFSGGTAPTSPTPVDGQGWYDTGAHVPSLMVNGAWEKLYAGKFFDVADFDLNQALNMLIENIGDAPAADASEVGRLLLSTTRVKARLGVNSSKFETIMSVSDVDYLAGWFPAAAWTPGTSTAAPAAGSSGSAPLFLGHLFTTTAQRAAIGVQVPLGYSMTANVLVRSLWVLNAGETSGDDLDVGVKALPLKPNSNEVTGATAITNTATQDCGAAAAGTLIQVTNTLAFSGSPPIERSDLLQIEIYRPTLAQVAGAVFLGAFILFPAGDRFTE